MGCVGTVVRKIDTPEESDNAPQPDQAGRHLNQHEWSRERRAALREKGRLTQPPCFVAPIDHQAPLPAEVTE